VITKDPNEVVQPLDDRMPVIIHERDYDRWLNVSDTQRLPIDLPRPFDADKMTAWKVDKAVGDMKNDSPELIEPASVNPNQVDERVPTKVQGPLFSGLPIKQVDGPPRVDK
jgi:putative SOS response-associated peptidase YedK